jgi:hypothetical protein
VTAPRFGLIAGDGHDLLVGALADRGEVVLVQPEQVAHAEVDAWCVAVRGVPPPVLQAIRDGDVPALFLVDPIEARGWHRVLRKGVHDLAWTPTEPEEVRARMGGILARRASWNHVTSSLCRELAHDLRGPLQALHFTVAALQNDGAVADGFQEDVDALLEATDVAGLMLDGIGNLGRTASMLRDDTPTLDLTTVVRAAASRRAYGGKVTVDVGEPLPVRCAPDALKGAIEDVVRVAWSRAAGKRQVRVHCLRFGAEGVVTAEARAYDALLDHLPALLWRERPILLRRERVPMPLAGLAFALDVARKAGGDVTVTRHEQNLRVELRLPLV